MGQDMQSQEFVKIFEWLYSQVDFLQFGRCTEDIFWNEQLSLNYFVNVLLEAKCKKIIEIHISWPAILKPVMKYLPKYVKCNRNHNNNVKKKVVWSGAHHCDIFKSSACGRASKAYHIGVPAVQCHLSQQSHINRCPGYQSIIIIIIICTHNCLI